MFEAQLKRTRRRKHGHPERSRGIPPRFLNSYRHGMESLASPTSLRDALRCHLVSRRRTALAFSLTVTAHLFYFGTFYCTGRAFEGKVMARAPSLGETFSIMPIVNTLTALPSALLELECVNRSFKSFCTIYVARR